VARLYASRGWFRGASLPVSGVALGLLVVLISNTWPTFAAEPWPTPPPGPQPSIPRVISQESIKRVSVPLVPGATSSEIPPLPMHLPRFPPVPGFHFEASESVRVISDAGSIRETLQLVYEPKPELSDAPSPGSLQELRKVFDLRVYDHQASRVSPELLRPCVLEVVAQGLSRSFEEPSRLIIARYDGEKGWVPLVTNYHIDRGILQARILEFGLFAVIHESRAITG